MALLSLSWQVFAFLGFLVSALWINAVATEVVNVLRTLGVVFQLSNTVLGLTLLAWGNSIGGEWIHMRSREGDFPAQAGWSWPGFAGSEPGAGQAAGTLIWVRLVVSCVQTPVQRPWQHAPLFSSKRMWWVKPGIHASQWQYFCGFHCHCYTKSSRQLICTHVASPSALPPTA